MRARGRRQKFDEMICELHRCLPARPPLYAGKYHDHVLEHQDLFACKGTPDAKPRPLQPGLMDEILKRARRGETVNEISGEGGPKHRGKGIVSRMRLLAVCFGDTPEAIELKGVLKQNAEAAVGNGKPLSRWSYASMAVLRTGYENGTDVKKITGQINAQFGRDFSVGAIYAKAHKLGLIERGVRIIIPRPAKLPPLTTALHFPTGSLLDRLNAIVPRYLARDHRDETIAEMYLAIAEGRLDEKDIQRRVREFVNLVDRRDHRSVSLDTAIPGTDLLRINTISEGAWA